MGVAQAQAAITPGFIGFIISLSLNGISIAQSVLYYRSFPRDGRVMKLIVLLLNIAELAQTSVLSNMFWGMLMSARFSRTGGDASLEKSPADTWQIKFSFAIAALITLFVQGFFCLRVWRVSRRNVALLVIIVSTALDAAPFLSLNRLFPEEHQFASSAVQRDDM
ncbi:hypothetical protein FIBSPDRAFT_363970 [Athelia psychrophila]|uniref:Uncharacterized protein n=1 Tax=Athelia psychrophila TaxID=1759441 RepID=A0A166PG59_9AGAM|nr:hypothetical protein FIBSPDRAFT_363970 [Fibularhizoctonia sp. CBS 109695]